MNKRRILCSFYSQELAGTAFFRHQSDTIGAVCPGKRRRMVVTSDDGDSEKCSASPTGLDSTFDLGSSDSDGSVSIYQQHQNQIPSDNESDNSLFDISSSSSSESYNSDRSSLDGEELWKGDSDLDEAEQQGEKDSPLFKVITGMFYFLTLFQLLYHLSERAINSLLIFLRLLFHHIGTILNNNILLKFANALPKTMSTV